MFAALMLVLSALAFVYRTARMAAPEHYSGLSRLQRFVAVMTPRAVVWFTALIVLYMLALERLGFLLSSFLFLGAAMTALGSRRMLFNVAVSAASLAAIYLVFQTVFSVVLPQGWLERTLLR